MLEEELDLPAFRAELARSSTRSSPTWNARWT
jgi:hypothetical protein